MGDDLSGVAGSASVAVFYSAAMTDNHGTDACG
jgi:hypothetical protein